MIFSHIRNNVSSKQASKKTDFTVDLIMMVGLTIKLAATNETFT